MHGPRREAPHGDAVRARFAVEDLGDCTGEPFSRLGGGDEGAPTDRLVRGAVEELDGRSFARVLGSDTAVERQGRLVAVHGVDGEAGMVEVGDEHERCADVGAR